MARLYVAGELNGGSYLWLLEDSGTALSAIAGVSTSVIPAPVSRLAAASTIAGGLFAVCGNKVYKLSRTTWTLETAWATAGVYTAPGTITDIALSPVDAGWLAVSVAGTGTTPDCILLKADGTDATGWTGGLSLPGAYDIGGAVSFNTSTGDVLYGPKYSGSSSYNWSNAGDLPISVWQSVRCSGDGRKVLAGNQNGYIEITVNGGTNWTERRPNGATTNDWRTAISRDGNRMFCCAYNGRLYTSITDGTTWVEANIDGIKANKLWRWIHSSATGQYVVACTVGASTGRIYLSSDYGVNFTSVLPASPPASNNWWYCAIDDTGVYISASEGTYGTYVSIDGGITFTNVKVVKAMQAWSSGGGKLFLASPGGAGECYYSNDQGAHWSNLSTGTANWYDISCSQNGQYILVPVYNKRVYYSSDGGATALAEIQPDGNASYLWYGAAVDAVALNLFVSRETVACRMGQQVHWTPLLLEVSKSDKTSYTTKGDDGTVRRGGICACQYHTGATEPYQFIRRDLTTAELCSYTTGLITLRPVSVLLTRFAAISTTALVVGGPQYAGNSLWRFTAASQDAQVDTGAAVNDVAYLPANATVYAVNSTGGTENLTALNTGLVRQYGLALGTDALYAVTPVTDADSPPSRMVPFVASTGTGGAASTLTAVGLFSVGAPSGIDAMHTVTLTIKDSSGATVCSKTFNNVTIFPTNGYVELGGSLSAAVSTTSPITVTVAPAVPGMLPEFWCVFVFLRDSHLMMSGIRVAAF